MHIISFEQYMYVILRNEMLTGIKSHQNVSSNFLPILSFGNALVLSSIPYGNVMNSKCCAALGYFPWLWWMIALVVSINSLKCDSCTGIIGFAVEDRIFTEVHNNNF